MPRQVTVTTGCRLHFGLLANEPACGRNYGGVGAMLNEPGFTLTACLAEKDEVHASPSVAVRITEFVQRYRQHATAGVPPCRIGLDRETPEHIGLGSGTQLGLAVARALAVLTDEAHRDLTMLAARVGRGARSALGFHGFQQGGLLVDGGKRRSGAISPLVARAEIPAEWRFVLVTPPQVAGLSGSEEFSAFRRLPPMSCELTGRLCAIVLMRLLPALHDGDCDSCGEALFEFGKLVGDYFAPVQGGTYADPRMAALIEHWRKEGVRGVGQSSWGPTVFALLPDDATAQQVACDLPSGSDWPDCTVRISEPLNHGATLAIVEV